MDGESKWYNHRNALHSCALAGASAMLAGITDAFMVANGPAWCYFYAMRCIERPELNIGHRFRCTYPSNGAVVFGTEKEIVQTLRHIRDTEKPGILLLENSCALSLIGDDLQGIAESVGLDCPIITIDSGGLLGEYWEGYGKALQEVLKKAEVEFCEQAPFTVNLIGCGTGYYNSLADLQEIRRILSLLGIKVNLSIGLHHSMQDLRWAKKATLTVVLHPELGLDGAKWIEKNWGIPYVSPTLPYGLEGTLAWAKEIAEVLKKDDNLYKELENTIMREKTRNFEYVKEMQRLWGEPWFDKVLVAGPGSVLQGIERVLTKEWLDCGEEIYVYHDSQGHYPDHYYSCQSNDWQKHVEEFSHCLLLGSNHEKKIIHDYKNKEYAYQTISVPVDDEVVLSHRPFMGIEGNRCFWERIWNEYIFRLQRGVLDASEQ